MLIFLQQQMTPLEFFHINRRCFLKCSACLMSICLELNNTYFTTVGTLLFVLQHK